MSIASQYNLTFYVYTLPSGLKKPSIGVQQVNGEYKNLEIASFLEPNGINYTQGIIDDIRSLNFDALVLDPLWGGNEDESVELKSHPPRAVFNTGGKEVEVPIADFLEILQEWKAFVQTVPDPHWLSRR